MSWFQSPGVQRAKFVAPEAYGFSGYGDAAFSQEIFNIPMAQIESIV
jgi:hypothetical protein